MRCMCGALDCRQCGPLQGVKWCEYCDKPMLSKEDEEFHENCEFDLPEQDDFGDAFADEAAERHFSSN